jgi:hypothetical protein
MLNIGTAVWFCGNTDFGLSLGVGIVSYLFLFGPYARDTTFLLFDADNIVK